jgi:tetratricopeptide (TPR) repeat protein
VKMKSTGWRVIALERLRRANQQLSHFFRKARRGNMWPRLGKNILPVARRCVTFVFGGIYNLATKLPWMIAAVGVSALLIHSLVQTATVVEPISVPRVLADSGYTPEVAGRRLRDAMLAHFADLKTQMQGPDVVLPSEVPNIVVPTVGISLDALVVTIRRLFRSTRIRSISGEFTISANRIWLRLRIDGREFYRSAQGGDTEKPDDLLHAAAADTLKVINPRFGIMFLRRDDPESAIRAIDKAIHFDPSNKDDHAWYYTLKGNIIYDRFDFSNAIVEYRRALDTNPKFSLAHHNMGNALREQRKYDEALVSHREAVRLNPKSPLYHTSLGSDLQLQRNYEAAKASYLAAIRLDPNFALAYDQFGHLLLAQNKNNEALAAYREAIRIDPALAQTHNGLAIVLRILGKDDEALTAHAEAIRLDPKNGLYRATLANIFEQLDRTEDAIANYQEAIRLTPTRAWPYNNLGEILDRQGKKNEAIALYREAARYDSTAMSYYNLGIALSELGENEQAVSAFRDAIRADPNYADAHNNLGVVLKEQGKNEEAVPAYRAAIRLDPNLLEARNSLADVLRALKRNDEAAAEYQAVLKIDPNNATAQQGLMELRAPQPPKLN